MELAELFVTRFLFCCEYDLIVVVERVAQCAVQYPMIAVAYGSSVYIGGKEAVTEWGTKTGVVSKLVEHTSG